MTRTIIDVHILQTVPPSNLNRDDTQSPKTAFYGGARRSRVSSQAWKRATRIAFNQTLDTSDLGVRTKQVVSLLASRITTLAADLEEQATELATSTLKSAGITTTAPRKTAAKKTEADTEQVAGESASLVFFSDRQITNLAEAAITAARSDDELSAALKSADVKSLAKRDHSIDIALFGRMVAETPDINVDASAQVAHAISVHPVEDEYDYFTAVDDRKHDIDETGAGMIGTVEFNSATLYRYANIDVNRLQDTLGHPDAARRAVEAFVRAFITSMPTGKQNTFANRTLPDLVAVKVRSTQPINLVGAFEEPVTDHTGTGRVQTATEKLAAYTTNVETSYGEQAEHTWIVRVGDHTEKAATMGEETTLPTLIETLGATITNRLTPHEEATE